MHGDRLGRAKSRSAGSSLTIFSTPCAGIIIWDFLFLLLRRSSLFYHYCYKTCNLYEVVFLLH
jgi:hypothetical protein